MIKSLIVLIAGVGVVAGLAIYIDRTSDAPIERVREVTATYKIYAAGRVEGATEEIELRPKSTGQVLQVLVEEGQFVEGGEVLLRLDDQEQIHQVSLAQADLKLAEAELTRLENGAHQEERNEVKALVEAKRADLKHAQQELERRSKLRVNQAISQQDLDDANNRVLNLGAEVRAAEARSNLLHAPARPDELEIARARISAARSKLDVARYQLDRMQLRSPFSGQILSVNVELGELWGPNSEEPAVILSDTRSYRVRGFVEELDAPRVKLGMMACVTADGLSGHTFRGTVVRLSPRMTNKEIWSDDPTERYDTKTREVWIELEQADGLVIGLRVDVMIEPGHFVELPNEQSVRNEQ